MINASPPVTVAELTWSCILFKSNEIGLIGIHCSALSVRAACEFTAWLRPDSSGGFALTDCGALSFLFFPPFSCLYLMYLYMSSVFVLLKGSFRSLQVTPFPLSSMLSHPFFHPLEECVCVCLSNIGIVVLSWLGVILLAAAFSSQASSWMSMRRLWMNQH